MVLIDFFTRANDSFSGAVHIPGFGSRSTAGRSFQSHRPSNDVDHVIVFNEASHCWHVKSFLASYHASRTFRWPRIRGTATQPLEFGPVVCRCHCASGRSSLPLRAARSLKQGGPRRNFYPGTGVPILDRTRLFFRSPIAGAIWRAFRCSRRSVPEHMIRSRLRWPIPAVDGIYYRHSRSPQSGWAIRSSLDQANLRPLRCTTT